MALGVNFKSFYKVGSAERLPSPTYVHPTTIYHSHSAYESQCKTEIERFLEVLQYKNMLCFILFV